MLNSNLRYLLIGLITLSSACQDPTLKADLILINAKIWTANPEQPTAEALAIAGDSIIAIGKNSEVKKFKSSGTEVRDLEGQFITPGFIDCHVHLMTGGRSLLSVDLRDADTPAEFTKRIAAYAQKLDSGTWILEGNWDHTRWGGALPEKEWIDRFTPNNPVAVYRLDGHMLLANSAALKFAGLAKNTPDVEGGEIIRHPDGSLTGVLKDNAMNLLTSQIPPMTAAQKQKIFQAAQTYFLSNGVTSVHDVDGLNNELESYSTAKALKSATELAIRLYALKPLSDWQGLTDLKHSNDKWLKVGGLKGFVDGSLGSHTAAFYDPYSDKPADKGFFINSKSDLYTWISQADRANLQLMVHAIGDSAIHVLLDIYEQIKAENGPKDRRLRIEHAQHIAPQDLNRFAELGVIASMQPYHAIDDGRWAEAVIGSERIKTTYAFRALLESKATVVFGSDWAVAPAAPLQGIYAAVTRRTLDGKHPTGWVPEQKITVEQALKAYTSAAAFAAYEEALKGSLEVGKLADFVVLSADLFKIDPTTIKDVKVLQTYVGGKKVFEHVNGMF